MQNRIAYSIFFQFLLLICSSQSFAQTNDQPPSTESGDRLKGYEMRKSLIEASSVAQVPFESVGPSIFGGRIVDLAVNPKDPSHFFAAYASGGLWKTTNNGISFEPMFDQEIVMTIGDIAVDWERDHIWIGSGENNSSRSSYSGVGIFFSKDGGISWEHRGLPESHHIGRIILHPTDENILWVAALGHLYSPNEERGVYKTLDGGKSWTKTLYVDENSGAIDLIIDPNDSNTLYASTWSRERRAWNFVESGLGSAIYKSTDAGESWTKVSGGNSGFPSTEGTGRIGLGIAQKNSKSLLYAIVDNYDRRPAKKKDKHANLDKNFFKTISISDFDKVDDTKLNKFLKSNEFPEKYTAKSLKKDIRKGKYKPIAIAEYLEDANRLLFDTPVIGAELYVSQDGGKKWTKTHEGYLDDLYYSYGYYFGQVNPNPANADEIYIYGVPILRSVDGGKTFKSISGDNVHADQHACWVNPSRSGHVILGNDGGVNISYDAGEHWSKCNTPAVGQFYYVAVDNAEPYNIYGGLQDNGTWVGASDYKASTRWQAQGKYPYEFLSGGDGMQVAIDLRNNNTVYSGFQFGNYFRINKSTGDTKYITPKHELGDRPYRWNWQTPIHLSVHNQDIFYMGSNKFHRSMNRGDDFVTISEDLTTGGKKGDIAFSTLTAIHESPLHFGLLYAGSDDGLVHVSKDGGERWEKITTGLPENMWVTRIQASAHEKGRVYLSMNGYRWDDFMPYLFVSEDYGASWRSLSESLPLEPINVIKEDEENPNLIYIGTDHGAYLSLNRGTKWHALQGGLPAAPVHDLVVQSVTEDLIIGTHGRSFWKGSVKEIRLLNSATLDKEIHLFEPDPMRRSTGWGSKESYWSEASIPEFTFSVWSIKSGPITCSIFDGKGNELMNWKTEIRPGINYLTNDLSCTEAVAKRLNAALDEEDKVEIGKNDKWYLPKGKYKIKIQNKGSSSEVDWEIN